MDNNQDTAPAFKPGNRQAWFIWSFAALAFGYAFFQRVAPSVMVSDLMADFAIGGAVLGTLSALYFYPYVFLQIPLGSLLDVWGTRILLFLAIAIAAIGSIIFALAPNIEIAYFGRILIGIGSSVGFLGAMALASRWFSINQFSLLTGLTMFFGMMSGMLAQAPLALLVDAYGWRQSMIGLGLVGIVLSLLILMFVRNSPPDPASTAPAVRNRISFAQSWRQSRDGLKFALTSLEVWKTALVASALSGPMLALGGLWGTPFLMSAYGLQKPEAAFFVSLLLIGWAIGAPTNGWLTDRYRHRKEFLTGGSIILCLVMAALIFLPVLPLWITIALFMITGYAGSVMTATFAHIRTRTPKKYGGAVAGIVNSMTVASGAVLQPLVGLVLDIVWDGKTQDGARVYTPEEFKLSFIVIFISTLIGLIICIRLKK